MKIRRRRAGFTLIEILVVIAILGVLAAILFGVVGHVRENGRRSTCQSNLKQIILAVQQYASDSDGRYPDDHFQIQLAPYIKASSWFECPTHQAFSDPKPGSFDSRVSYIFGYFYNGTRLTQEEPNGRTLKFTGKHEATLPDTAITWVFGDDNAFDTDTGRGFGGTIVYDHCDIGSNPWTTMHNGGANYGFLDGHVKWLNPSGINKLHCSNQQQ